MKHCSTAELQQKELINLCDGMRLGYIDEFELDLSSGCITAILLYPRKGLLCYTKEKPMRIPWDHISCIGEDAILVKIDSADTAYCHLFKKAEKKIRYL